MLSYGCTRLEIGLQSTYEDVARDTNRGHTVAAVGECFRLAKNAGFKVRPSLQLSAEILWIGVIWPCAHKPDGELGVFQPRCRPNHGHGRLCMNGPLDVKKHNLTHREAELAMSIRR